MTHVHSLEEKVAALERKSLAAETRVATIVDNYHVDRHKGSGHVNNSFHNDSRGNSRTCSYKDFSNCKPKNFYGNGEVIELSRWFEKIE